jgi:putative methionine-R-sulfoxide reductase with GAF domain
MTVSLPQEKKEIIANECERLLNKQTAKIRDVARVLGLIVSSFSAVDYARLYYRENEKAKMFALIKSCGNFDASMKITSNMREELNWWFTNVYKQKKEL